LCIECRNRKLSKVVCAIDDGIVTVDADNPLGRVPYLILELAESDVRAELEKHKRFDTAMALRTLHHVAVGLDQLHRNGISHQDLKPSNVLLFQNKVSKVGDLGSAVANTTALFGLKF
jgi:serine/threonine protein kinase